MLSAPPSRDSCANCRYPGALLVAVACLAVRARGVRDNNREAAFIGLAVGLSLPIWISSGIGSIAAGSEGDREAWLAYGLLATSLFVFLTMFLPKGRQLAALGREGPATVIRDDALSSLPGSGYSPSFFHFKPAEASLKRKMHYHSAGRSLGPVEESRVITTWRRGECESVRCTMRRKEKIRTRRRISSRTM